MSRSCSVCGHEDSVLINEALVLSRQSNRRIAAQYGLTESAIRRHREHIPQLLLKAAEAEEVYNAEVILDKIRHLETEALEVLEAAKGDDERGLILQAIREQRHNLELVARVIQLINEAPQVNVNLSLHPEFVEFKTLVLTSLEPYPEARGALLDAVRSARLASGGLEGAA